MSEMVRKKIDFVTIIKYDIGSEEEKGMHLTAYEQEEETRTIEGKIVMPILRSLLLTKREKTELPDIAERGELIMKANFKKIDISKKVYFPSFCYENDDYMDELKEYANKQKKLMYSP